MVQKYSAMLLETCFLYLRQFVFFKNVSFFFFFFLRDRVSGGGAETEGDKGSKAGSAPHHIKSSEPNVGLELTNHHCHDMSWMSNVQTTEPLRHLKAVCI